MKTKISILLALFIFINTFLTTAQTNVSGGIYSNTTWTKVNSPYIVTGNIVLFPGKILTIEPGVEVKFNDTLSLEIRGKLIAIGTITDSISFISNTSSTNWAWKNINILNISQNAVGLFEYCKVSNADYGVTLEGGGLANNPSYINNSLFDNNHDASGYYGWNFAIDRCSFTNNFHGINGWDEIIITNSVFTNNTMAINGMNKIIKNSTFINNDLGISCAAFEARNCFFQYNTSAIDCWSGSSDHILIDSCTIINNNIGIRVNIGSITNNNISNNVFGVITQQASTAENGIQYYVPIKNNHICDNTQYNIKNDNVFNKNITGNCFCTADSTIIESKLFDGYDDISKGLFNYDIYDSTCQNVIQSVYKVGANPLSSNNILSSKPVISFFPNPFSDFISVQFDINNNNVYSLRIYNSMGQKVQQVENVSGQQKTIDSRNLEKGIYLLQFIQDGIIVAQRKLIKE